MNKIKHSQYCILHSILHYHTSTGIHFNCILTQTAHVCNITYIGSLLIYLKKKINDIKKIKLGIGYLIKIVFL